MAAWWNLNRLSGWWQNSPCPDVKGSVEACRYGHFNQSRSTLHYLCLLIQVGPRAMRNHIARNWLTYFFVCNEGSSCVPGLPFLFFSNSCTYESTRLLSLFRFCLYWMCDFQVSRVFDVNSSLEKRPDTTEPPLWPQRNNQTFPSAFLHEDRVNSDFRNHSTIRNLILYSAVMAEFWFDPIVVEKSGPEGQKGRETRLFLW